jgi:uncharacterized protein
MDSCLFKELLYFDPSKPTLKIYNLVVLGIAIMIASNIIFVSILKLFGSNVLNDIDQESKDGFHSYKNKNIHPTTLFMSDILNSVIYASITEELFFRFFLLKTILIRKFNMSFHTANLLQSFIFGFFHLTNTVYTEQKNTTTFAQMLSASISGLINGYVYFYSNSIIPSVVSHVLNNLLASHFNFTKYNAFYESIKNVIHF